jgi:hypothetical protein
MVDLYLRVDGSRWPEIGLSLGYLILEFGLCVKIWAIEQGSGPNLGYRLSQI